MAEHESIEDLVKDLGIKEFTPGMYWRQRARIGGLIGVRHDIGLEDIDDAIRAGRLPEDELVSDWIALDVMKPE